MLQRLRRGKQSLVYYYYMTDKINKTVIRAVTTSSL